MSRAALHLGAIAAAGLALGLIGGAAPAPVLDPVAGPRCQAAEGEVATPAGVVDLGEDGPGRPGRRVEVAAFAIDRHEVTNRQFLAFVRATGYVTQAEREGGSAVFAGPTAVQGWDDPSQWWRYERGASWRRPLGPDKGAAWLDAPVVHVTRADAEAYARWAGRRLPTEAEWEHAARGGRTGTAPPWSWAYDDAGTPTANTWQGVFPVADSHEDGHAGIAPVGCYEANGFGLHDMVGNVWEITATPAPDGERLLIKGGSFLCAFNYCANFRPAAWQAQEADFGASHIGFRTVRSLEAREAD